MIGSDLEGLITDRILRTVLPDRRPDAGRAAFRAVYRFAWCSRWSRTEFGVEQFEDSVCQ
jgi:hypothetical protein